MGKEFNFDKLLSLYKLKIFFFQYVIIKYITVDKK